MCALRVSFIVRFFLHRQQISFVLHIIASEPTPAMRATARPSSNLESLYRESSDIEGPEKSSHVIAWSHFESIADRNGRISVSVLTFPLYAAFSFVFYIDFTTK